MKKYIDQEAVIHLIETEGYNEKYDLGHPKDNDWFCEEVKRIPAADVVEVKHGKWVKSGQSFVYPHKFRNYSCSVCGYDIEKTKYNYCPNCGTKMDGGSELKEYIERDAALQDMWNALYALEDQREKHHGLDWFERKNLQDGFEAGQGVIANRPAADVVVRHGRWIHTNMGGWKCSECNNQAPFWCMASTQNLSDYCPNCGAKMDGGADDTNADKYFRNATDEEIAEIVVEDWCELLNCNCQMEKSLYRTCDGMCKERVLDWLKQEVQDDRH